MKIRVNVLGALELSRADEAIRVSGRKQRVLLAALLVHAPRAVSAARLVDALWGDELPADPQAGLQVNVSRLRRALDAGDGCEEVVVTEPHGYRLDVSVLDVDAMRFEAAVNEARRSSDPVAALSLIDEGLGLWRGAAFAEFADLPFAHREAQRLEELRTAAVELSGELLIGLGRFEEAISVLEPVIAVDPLRERPCDQTARALYHLGRQGDALAVCRQLRRRLGEELGLDPSPAMARLEEQILRHELETESERPSPDRSRRAGSGGFVGPGLEISYVDAAGRSIAVGQAGSGATLVVLPSFVSNLGTIAGGRDPRSRLLAVLAERFHLVTYDRCGTGLSSGDVDSYSVEASAAELGGVLDAIGEAPVALLAISCAGPIAVTLAAERPEAVSRLVFFGTYVDGGATFGDPAITASLTALVRAHWGLGSKLLMDLMYPCASSEFVRRFARGQRDAAPTEVAACYLESMFSADVSDRVADVRAPSLVIHYTGDRAIPFRGSRGLAAGLPDARLVPLGGSLHIPEGEDTERVATLIQEFVEE